MELQVLNIEQCQNIMALGIDMSNASCLWSHVKAKRYLMWRESNNDMPMDEEEYLTFTFQDIIELLPKELPHWKENVKYRLYMQYGQDICTLSYEAIEISGEYTYTNVATLKYFSGTPIEVAYKMLIFCKEKNYI